MERKIPMSAPAEEKMAPRAPEAALSPADGTTVQAPEQAHMEERTDDGHAAPDGAAGIIADAAPQRADAIVPDDAAGAVALTPDLPADGTPAVTSDTMPAAPADVADEVVLSEADTADSPVDAPVEASVAVAGNVLTDGHVSAPADVAAHGAQDVPAEDASSASVAQASSDVSGAPSSSTDAVPDEAGASHAAAGAAQSASGLDAVSGQRFCGAYGRALWRCLLLLCLTLWPLSAWWLAQSGDAALDAVVERQAAGEFVLFGSALAQSPDARTADGGTAAADGVLLYKLRLYEAVRPDVVVLGSWRMARLGGEVFSRPFVNMGGAIHTLADLRYVVDAMLRGHRPQVVILGADFWWFAPRQKAAFWREAPQNPFTYGPVSLRQLWARVLEGQVTPLPALRLLAGGREDRYGLLAQSEGDGFGPDGAWRDVAIPTGQRPSPDRGFAATLARAREARGEFAAAAAPDMNAVETFAEIVCRLRARGIQTIVVLPPLAVPVLEVLRADESRWPQLFALRQALLDRGMDVLDFTDPRRFGSGDCEMLDGLHAGGVASLRMLRDITDRHQVMLNYVDMARINDALLNWKKHVFVRDARLSPLPEVDFLEISCRRKS